MTAQIPGLTGEQIGALEMPADFPHGCTEGLELDLKSDRVQSALTFARQFESLPLAGIIYTDIARDGMLQGPNLDSIAEFRILTDNFDAEFGNYSGGIINVITKSGSNQLHGTVFDFLRNTDLDARNYFSPERSFYRQNQFGGTVGGPIRQNKVFYFGDYQGTRQSQGVDTGLIPVPNPTGAPRP